MLDVITQMLSNPMVTHLLTFAVGWATLPQLQMFSKLWSAVMGAKAAADQVEKIIEVVDAILKQHKVVAPDASVDVAKVMKAVAKK